MNIFIIGMSGQIGRLLATRLQQRGDTVSGLVRRPDDQLAFDVPEIEAHLGDLALMTPNALAALLRGTDAIVFTAGSNGGERHVTKAIDHDAVLKTIEAALIADVSRLVLVSVLPESWRERQLDDDVEYYFAVKKETEVAVSRTTLDWVILRPSLLTDRPPSGRVALGPAELHGQISRHDVASTLEAVLHEPRIYKRILELNEGTTPIRAAVAENVPSDRVDCT